MRRDAFGGFPLYQKDGRFSTKARELGTGRMDAETALEAVLSADLAVLFGDRTLHEGVREVPPAEPNPLLDNPRSRQPRAPAEVRRLLRDAVADCIGSSRRVAVALSGGVDSSAVAALAVELLGPRNVEAFTYEFQEPSRPPEAPWAALVASRLGIRHRVVPVEREAALRAVPDLFKRLEAPRVAPVAWLFYAPALREAGYDQVLTGDGLELALDMPGPLDLPKPDLPTYRHWKGRRFEGWPVRRLLRALHPRLEPPHDHSYHMILCVLRHNGRIDDVGAFYPQELAQAARRSAESPRVREAVLALAHLPLDEQLRRHRMRSYVLHRLFGGKLAAYSELGAIPVCPALRMKDPPSRSGGGARLRRLAFENDVPAEVFARPKVRNHSIIPEPWLAELDASLAELRAETAQRLGCPALVGWFGRELGRLGLWRKEFDR